MTVEQDPTSTAGKGSDADRARAGRARWAVTGVFFVNGLLLSTYISRIPAIKADHGFGDAGFGTLLALVGVAAVLSMQVVGRLVARFGSSRLIRTMLLAMPPVLVAVGFAPGTAGLAAALVLLGLVHGCTDVAMNGHAVAVERLGGRPVMNGCHAAWSISAVAASLIGAGAIRLGVEPAWHLSAVAAVMLVAGLPLTAALLPADTDRSPAGGKADDRASVSRSARGGWDGRVLRLGSLAAAVMVCEAAVITWSGVFLHEVRGAAPAAAALGFTAYTACQTAVRLVGDRLTTRVGAATVFRLGGLVGLAGIALVALAPSAVAGIAGFAVFGAGTAALLPLLFSAVGHLGGDGPGATTAVARATTLAYGGILLGPALIGWLAAGVGLHRTFAGLLPLLALVVLGRPFRPEPPAAARESARASAPAG